MVVEFEARLVRVAVHTSCVGEQVKLQFRVVVTALSDRPQDFARKNDRRFAPEFNYFLNSVWIPSTQVLDDNISFLAGTLSHRREALRRRLILMPVERALFPQIEVTH